MPSGLKVQRGASLTWMHSSGSFFTIVAAIMKPVSPSSSPKECLLANPGPNPWEDALTQRRSQFQCPDASADPGLRDNLMAPTPTKNPFSRGPYRLPAKNCPRRSQPPKTWQPSTSSVTLPFRFVTPNVTDQIAES